MRAQTGAAMSSAVTGVIVGAGLVSCDGSDRSVQPGERSSAQVSLARGAALGPGAPRAFVRGCRDRIEGFVPPPDGTDTTIGPVAFKDLPAAYRFSSRHPGVGMKSISLVRAGARVTLVVPRGQRRWLTVHYGGERLHERQSVVHAITLRACRRFDSRRARRRECGWGSKDACGAGDTPHHTLFSGGVGIDFARAPKRGLCAELIVWVEGRTRPLREHLFRPGRGECRSSSLAPSGHPRGVRVDCSRRSEDDFPGAFSDPRNLVVGPLVLVSAGKPTPAAVVREFGGNKFPLLVKAGRTVTVRLPRGVRGLAGLAYGGLGRGPLPEGEVRLRDTAHTMTFVACQPGGPAASYEPDGPSAGSADAQAVTFWSGFVVTRAPACVPLEVYIDNQPSPRHAVIDMGAGHCRR